MSNLKDLDKDMQQYGARTSSDMFEFKKGVNRIRILNFPTILATHFFGKGVPSHVCTGMDEGCPFHGKNPDDKEKDYKSPSLKLVTYIIDRMDGKVKLAELPLSLRYALDNLQEDEDFAFEDFPMPYDVKVTHDPDNKDPKSMYTLIGSPKQESLTAEEEADLKAKMERMTPEQYVQKRKDKQKEKREGGEIASAPGVQYPEEEINAEDIPF